MRRKALHIRVYEWSRDLFRKFFETVSDLITDQRVRRITLQAIPYWLAAVLTATIAVGYALLFKAAEELNHFLLAPYPELIFLIAPVGFLLSWWLVVRYAPLAGGSGIPQLMAAVDLASDKKRDRSGRLLNIRIILVKIASSVVMVAGGGAVGREGPTLHIAGSIYRTVHKFLPDSWPKVSRRIMITTGGAAGLSAAFNTPLGGIVYVVEDLSKTHIAQFRTAVLGAVILSGMTAQWLLGPYLFLGYPKVQMVGFSFMWKVLIVALATGALGAIIAKLVLAGDKLRRRMSQRKAFFFVIMVSLLFATTVYLLGPYTTGPGKPLLEALLFHEDTPTDGRLVFSRLLGPLFSSISGGAGGIFAPALASGAAIAAFIAELMDLPRADFNLLVLSGMVGFLTGVTRSPFTSAILVLEMTDRHSVIFQLMYAAMFASLIAYTIDKRSFYDRMASRVLATVAPEYRGRSDVAPHRSKRRDPDKEG